MEPMVRPAHPASWNHQNRQGTVWNRPEPEPERLNQVPIRWNRNRMEPEQIRPNPDHGHH